MLTAQLLTLFALHRSGETARKWLKDCWQQMLARTFQTQNLAGVHPPAIAPHRYMCREYSLLGKQTVCQEVKTGKGDAVRFLLPVFLM